MSKIEWTDETWNPATGCTKISPGCKNCYMFREYPRLAGMGVPGYADGKPSEVRLMPNRLDAPKRWKKPRMVFVNSMSDLFHEYIPMQYILDVFEVMQDTPQHTYQVLTKRPDRALRFWSKVWAGQAYGKSQPFPPNVWLGVSVENQDYAWRVDAMASIDCEIKFVSAEPLIGELALDEFLEEEIVQWVICGGESGPKARPMELDWARRLRDECKATNTPFFLKQLGGKRNKHGGDLAVLDGERFTEFPKVIAP